ncbi:MAG: cysteine desulfurase [Alphaproteobacteria bacterium]|nr:cysteine desulfurase [Alphaproteobacteria bacterium]
MTARVYLDWNATAPVAPDVAHAVAERLTRPGNASSTHAEGREARREIERAREEIARLLDAAPGEVVFLSGGSEANALALRGLVAARAAAGRPVRQIIVSAIEHDSVWESARALGLDVYELPVLASGQIDLDALETQLSREPASLVSLMLANNETGVMQPVEDAARLAAKAGALIHSDAVQGPGKITVSFKALGLDAMTISGHKFGAPQGTGALILREGVEIEPQIRGGRQELGRRAGTENVAAIMGLGLAAAKARNEDHFARPALRHWFEEELRRAVPHAVIYGEGAPRLPNTVCVGVEGFQAETQVIALDLAGFAVSAGAACSSGKVRQSRVLTAMGVDSLSASSAIRVSWGQETRQEELERFRDAWAAHIARATRVRPKVAGAAE